MNRFITIMSTLLLVVTLAACGGDTSDSGATPTDGSSAKVLLDKDPAGAVSITDARAKQEGDEVTVFGRISKLPGQYVAFTLTDETLDYCGRGTECEGTCTTPWDYCCIQSEKVSAGSLPVEMRDASGNPVALSDTEMFRLLDLVAVKGTLQKTESGGMMLVIKEGVFRRDRPILADHVVWPKP